MLAIKLSMEGFGLGFLLYLVCAIGIRNGAVGMIHLYEQTVQNRAVELGMTTEEEINKRSLLFKAVCIPGYMIYDTIHQVLAQGNYVLAVSEGTFGGAPTSYYDLWRIENGKVTEHWDVMETIAEKDTWQNQNGKF